MSLRFKGRIDDGFGPLLDNMRVIQAVIPEPATWGDADRRLGPFAGFGLVGTATRRCRTAVAA
jgi:hypothetical protein